MAESAGPTYLTYAGAIINPITFGHVEFIRHGLVVVDQGAGVINQMLTFDGEDSLRQATECLNAEHKLHVLEKDEILLPGLIDMHTHAPQYRNLGLGLDFPLLEWLEKVTFPEERSYYRQDHEDDADYLQRIKSIYEPMVQQYLNWGTTTCCYFGSLQMEANQILVDAVAAAGQRALIGKTCMDRNSPPNYIETTERSVGETEAFIDYIRQADGRLKGSGLIRPVVTPRFAISCTSESMSQLSKIAQREQVHIQTHMNENKDEIAFVKTLFPDCETYAGAYEANGILGPKTFLAHCVHMTEEEVHLLSKTGASAAHCPTSNFALNSGIANVRELLAAGVHVGLGTDVSGGYGFSILDAMRQAIIASKALQCVNSECRPLTVPEAFHLATQGGAEALSLSDEIGNFAVGKKFDAILVDMKACPHVRHADETLKQSLERFVFTGDDRWIKKVFVNGSSVKDCL